jgi:acyl-CoA synthetase (AMP-forming)/AMP-acid ligase II/acyl carrier protein
MPSHGVVTSISRRCAVTMETPPSPASAPADPAIVPDLLRRRAAEQPRAVALVVDGGDSLAYGAWEARSNAVARGLAAGGVRPGDRVGLVFANSQWVDYAVAYLAAHKAGAVAVPLGPRFSGPELDRVLRHCQARVVVHMDGGGIDVAGAVVATTAELERGRSTEGFQADVRPGDLAEILYTSGTTGLPKGVACTHAGIMVHDPPPEQPEEPGGGPAFFVHAFPVGTNAGQEVLRLPLRRGDRVAVALPVFDPERFCAVIAQRQVRRLQLVPAMGQLIVASGATSRHDVSSVERVVVSSAPSSPALLGALAKAFPGATMWNTYALTEAGTARTLMVDAASRPGSVGLPVGGTELRIVDDAGHDARRGAAGEVWIRRPGAPLRSYYRDPEATAATFMGDGWVRTGDIGRIDGDGHLFLVDRKKDLIIVGGLNVSSVEVENVLFEHPAVADVAVFGVPHEVLGQDVAAAVVARSTVDAGALQAFVRNQLGEHKVPHHLVFVDELPRTPTGKVRKYDLRDRFAADRRATPFVAPRSPVEAAVVQIWEAVLGREGIGAEDDFFDLNGHSLAAAQIVARVQDTLGVTIPLASIFETPTPAGLAATIVQIGADGGPGKVHGGQPPG